MDGTGLASDATLGTGDPLHATLAKLHRQCRCNRRATKVSRKSLQSQCLGRQRQTPPAACMPPVGNICRGRAIAARYIAPTTLHSYSNGTMLNSLETEGRPQDTRVVVAMSGGVELLGDGCAAQGRGLRRGRRHASALRPRRGDPPQGRLLRRPGHLRRSVSGRPARHPALRARLRAALQGGGDRPLRRKLRRGRDAGALRRLQHGDQVQGPARRPRASLARRCWRPGITSPRGPCRPVAERCSAPRTRNATRATSCSAPRSEQLDLLRFPLGDMSKAQTRELARRFGLAVADKHDSQDICFVPSGRYTDVIERLKPGAAAAGDIVDLDGKVLGRHDGIIHFTVGQRRGLKIASGAPLYVVALDAARRRVVVGPREALTMRRIALRDVNWIGEGPLERALDGGRRSMCSSRCARPGRRSRRSCPLRAAGRGRTGGRRGRRLARSGLRILRRRGGSGPRAGRRLHPRGGGERREPRNKSRRSALRGDGATTSTSRPWPRPMRVGPRSTILCSARCSSAAAWPRSWRRSRRAVLQAGASSMSASAPASRCRTIRAATASSASTIPSRCCARRRSA